MINWAKQSRKAYPLRLLLRFTIDLLSSSEKANARTRLNQTSAVAPWKLNNFGMKCWQLYEPFRLADINGQLLLLDEILRRLECIRNVFSSFSIDALSGNFSSTDYI